MITNKFKRLVSNYLNHHLKSDELYAEVNELYVIGDKVLVDYIVAIKRENGLEIDPRKTTLTLTEV